MTHNMLNHLNAIFTLMMHYSRLMLGKPNSDSAKLMD